mmetsp:Transcript_1616/g.2310  ORF Transcript_1616/g.2310 Transcript_1616/m.2310 type:complete len:496 (-) Transcript_1616:186-1673(-)
MTRQVNEINEWSQEESSKQAEMLVNVMETRGALMRKIEESAAKIQSEQEVVKRAMAFVQMTDTVNDAQRRERSSARSGSDEDSNPAARPSHTPLETPVNSPPPRARRTRPLSSHPPSNSSAQPSSSGLEKEQPQGAPSKSSLPPYHSTSHRRTYHSSGDYAHPTSSSPASKMLDPETQYEIAHLANPTMSKMRRGLLPGPPARAPPPTFTTHTLLFPEPATPQQQRFTQGYETSSPPTEYSADDSSFRDSSLVIKSASTGAWPVGPTEVLALRAAQSRLNEKTHPPIPLPKSVQQIELTQDVGRGRRGGKAVTKDIGFQKETHSRQPKGGHGGILAPIGWLIKVASLVIVGRFLHAAHREGKLQPAAERALETTKEFLNNISARVSHNGSKLQRKQRSAQRKWRLPTIPQIPNFTRHIFNRKRAQTKRSINRHHDNNEVVPRAIEVSETSFHHTSLDHILRNSKTPSPSLAEIDNSEHYSGVYNERQCNVLTGRG